MHFSLLCKQRAMTFVRFSCRDKFFREQFLGHVLRILIFPGTCIPLIEAKVAYTYDSLEGC